MKRDWWAVRGAVAIISAIGEVIGALFIGFAAAAYAAAAVFRVGWYFVRRRSRIGLAVVRLMSVVELLGLPFYKRQTAADWISQGVFLILGVAGVAAAVGVLRVHRDVSGV